MCAEALTKHLDKTCLLQCTDFLKIAFIVNKGLLLLDEEDLEGFDKEKEAEALTSTNSVNELPPKQSLLTASKIESKSEFTMAEIEQQMNDLLSNN